MKINTSKQIKSIKMELTPEEFNTLYMAMNITSSSDICRKAEETETKVLNGVDQMRMFHAMQDVYKEV